jgi:hypothetical protein
MIGRLMLKATASPQSRPSRQRRGPSQTARSFSSTPRPCTGTMRNVTSPQKWPSAPMGATRTKASQNEVEQTVPLGCDTSEGSHRNGRVPVGTVRDALQLPGIRRIELGYGMSYTGSRRAWSRWLSTRSTRAAPR